MTSPFQDLLTKLEKLLNRKIQPHFSRYNKDADSLLAPLKWKPLVLVIGNYSSGKSTFINELLGKAVQRVGQAPTDDSFTIITRNGSGREDRAIPGSSVVTDDSLPFGSLRKFGEKLAAHLWLKYVDVPELDQLAIIDTPGMLDSVTEKDRGYDYLRVIGELARLSDVIILMFDPHKAGTIKETYRAIRSTLPGSTGEDRIFYAMNRIDECENSGDLIKSFGALCWNLSQMTGRKDIPRIFLTFAEDDTQEIREEFSVWHHERQELKDAVFAAPRMRINHVFEEIDRGIQELIMQLEAYASFHHHFMQKVKKVSRVGSLLALLFFLAGDIFLNYFTGYPKEQLIYALLDGNALPSHLILPVSSVAVILFLMSYIINRIILPFHKKQHLLQIDALIPLDSSYRRDLWQRVRPLVEAGLEKDAKKIAWGNHKRVMNKMKRFLGRDLKKLYEKYKKQDAE